jgi:hypothetical protein
VKIGLQIIEFDWPGGAPASAPALRDIAVAAEDAGYSSLWQGSGLDDVRRWRSTVEAHCADVGRDPAGIERTAHATVDFGQCGDDDLRQLRDDLASAGVSYLIVNLMPRCEIANVRRAAAAVLG